MRDLQNGVLGDAGMEFQESDGTDGNVFFEGRIREWPSSMWWPGEDYSDHLDHDGTWRSLVDCINGQNAIHDPCPLGIVCRGHEDGVGIVHYLAHSGWGGWSSPLWLTPYGMWDRYTTGSPSLRASQPNVFSALQAIGHNPVVISDGCGTGEFYHGMDELKAGALPGDEDCVTEFMMKTGEGGPVGSSVFLVGSHIGESGDLRA